MLMSQHGADTVLIAFSNRPTETIEVTIIVTLVRQYFHNHTQCLSQKCISSAMAAYFLESEV